ncbi:hypothetical protein A8709_16135 [Paenibacillus pectinilyticus]|uniref:Uncharacterized protein n=1 Tax=Paenibacillus pectinilyticus TaxID=512399 RepID=A0A1C1A4W4_9BACL|nr:hypothetical protein [Paenibacillus pectinilyticus]OCT15597.1 hypothetical protein A8709_16135 [Paenibacillus pectinilyticus]
MKIYVILSFDGETLENVYVGPDEEKALAFTPADFENCDALFVEIWEDGEKTDDFRLVEDEEDEAELDDLDDEEVGEEQH